MCTHWRGLIQVANYEEKNSTLSSIYLMTELLRYEMTYDARRTWLQTAFMGTFN